MKSFKTIIKTKLIADGTKQYVELRDYELNKSDLKIIHCKSKDYRRCYHINEEFMILGKARHGEGKVINTQQSMFYPYAYYKLVRFLWKPKGEVENKNIANKEIIFIGNKAILP